MRGYHWVGATTWLQQFPYMVQKPVSGVDIISLVLLTGRTWVRTEALTPRAIAMGLQLLTNLCERGRAGANSRGGGG